MCLNSVERGHIGTLAHNSFRWRGAWICNALPPKIRNLSNCYVLLFKSQLDNYTLKAVHTAAVSKSRRKQTVNRVLRGRPPDISETETLLRRPQRTTLSQIRSGHCHLLNSYKHRICREDDPQGKDCGYDNQDVNQ